MNRRAIRWAAAAVVVAGAAAALLLATPLHPWSSSHTVAKGASRSTGGHATPAPRSPAPASPSAPQLHDGLNVLGNRLVDGSGTPVVLHGANISGTESACAQNWTDDPFGGQPEDDPRTIAAMRSWHFNAVRIPLNEDCWLGINGVRIQGAAYRDPIVRMVHEYEQAGFYVIVDLHWSAPGGQRAVAQNPAPDSDHSPAFWQSVAATFRGDGRVVFDLFNEPYFYWIASGNADAWTCLWRGCAMTQYVTGGSPYTVNARWTTAGFDELIAVIRGTGATNVIMAAGVNWARDLSGWLAHRPADGNVIASWHAYHSANAALQSECAERSCWDDVVAPLARTVPVVVGETGDSTAGPETFLPSFLPWADGHGMSYLAWTWNAWQDPENVLVTDMLTGAPTSGEGAMVRGFLARSGGSG